MLNDLEPPPSKRSIDDGIDFFLSGDSSLYLLQHHLLAQVEADDHNIERHSTVQSL